MSVRAGNQNNRKEAGMEKTNWIKIADVYDLYEAGMLKNLLAQEGIESVIKKPEAGEFLNIYMGNSIFGAEIYVDPSHAEKATQLFEAFFKAKGDLLAEEE
jgi:hypothetical protein